MQRTRSAGGVVVNASGQILVVSQKGTSWSLPKGHINVGETAHQAALREIREESGLTALSFIKRLGVYRRYRIALDGGDDMRELKTITMYLYKTTEHALRPQDPANPEARWVKPDEVAKLLTHQKDKHFFETALSQIQSYLQ